MPTITVAQELMSTPCVARPGLGSQSISAGRASASRALSSEVRAEAAMNACSFKPVTGIGCCAVKEPRPPTPDNTGGCAQGRRGHRGVGQAVEPRPLDSDPRTPAHRPGRKSILRRPQPASRTYLAHLGCGVAPGPHEDHGQGRGEA